MVRHAAHRDNRHSKGGFESCADNSKCRWYGLSSLIYPQLFLEIVNAALHLMGHCETLVKLVTQAGRCVAVVLPLTHLGRLEMIECVVKMVDAVLHFGNKQLAPLQQFFAD